MNHSFNIEEAAKYGLEEAIIIENMRFWISKNISAGRHYYDGKTWTYNSVRAFSLLFPYMSEQKIRRILQSLIKQGVIVTGNYNKVGYDRTTWYAFSNISILQNRQMEVAESTNGSVEIDEPIPDISTDISTDINTDNKPVLNPSVSGKSGYTKKVIDLFHGLYLKEHEVKPITNGKTEKLAQALCKVQPFDVIEKKMKAYFKNKYWFSLDKQSKETIHSFSAFYMHFDEINCSSKDDEWASFYASHAMTPETMREREGVM